MEQKLVTTTLSVLIGVLVVFIGSFSWFMVVKERVCAANLNSPACGESYPAFLLHETGR